MMVIANGVRSPLILLITLSSLTLWGCMNQVTKSPTPPALNSIDPGIDHRSVPDAWQRTLMVDPGTSRQQIDLEGPTAVSLPAPGEPTEISWAVDGNVTVYTYTDRWQVQKSRGTLRYSDSATLAFLPGPAAAASALISWGAAPYRCGDIAEQLSDSDTAWSAPVSSTRAAGQAAAEALVPGRVSTEAGLAVLGYDCPSACPTPVAAGNVTHRILDSDGEYSYFASLGGPDRYYGWAEYQWFLYVKCTP